MRESRPAIWATRRAGLVLFTIVWLLAPCAIAAGTRVRVVVEAADVKVAPDIGSSRLARATRDLVLESTDRAGEWYKVLVEQDGVRLSGFIHELLVEEVQNVAPPLPEPTTPSSAGGAIGNETNPVDPPQVAPVQVAPPQVDPVPASSMVDEQAEQLLAAIEQRLDEGRKSVRDGTRLDETVVGLGRALAMTFNIADPARRREIAAQLFLWLGLAHEKLGDDRRATGELLNMFEAGGDYARELTRNVVEPKIMSLIDFAERQSRGLAAQYALEVTSEPAGALVIVDGKERGFTPILLTVETPRVEVDLGKKGFVSIRETLALVGPTTRRNFVLVSAGIEVSVHSDPAGGRILVDGENTGQVTNATLLLAFGSHRIRIERERYAGWQTDVEVKAAGAAPSLDAVLVPVSYQVVSTWKEAGGEVRVEAPAGVALAADGSVLVIGNGANKVGKWLVDGQFDEAWAKGGKFRKLEEPGGIAVDRDGTIFVTDAKRDTILKFSGAGEQLEFRLKVEEESDRLRQPRGIAIDSMGTLYVADSGNFRIRKYSNAGLLLTSWGSQGSEAGQFSNPRAVAVGPRDEVVVLDSSRIQKFGSDGNFVRAFQQFGDQGTPAQGSALWFDAQGYLYVADAGNKRILKVDAEGNLLAEIRGTDGEIAPTAGVADRKGNLYIAERWEDQVRVLTPLR